MSTFLQICQKARKESGIAGTDTPTTVVGQTGILGKLVDRTAKAWVDIQTSRPYWKFHRAQLTFATVIGQRTYTRTDIGLNTIDKWNKESVFIYLTSTSDELQLAWKEYDWFRRTNRAYTAGRPTQITETPGNILAFDHVPDAIYTVTLDYWKTPELLALDADIPNMPEQYHDIIAWKSVMSYAGSQGAAELYSWAEKNYNGLHFQLVMDQGDMPAKIGNFPIAQGNRTLGAPVWPRP